MAYDYPLLGIFWSMFILFMWIIWFTLMFRIFADIFRSDDLGGFAKTMWMIFVIVLPFLGVLIYVITRGPSMTARDLQQAQRQRAAFEGYVRETAGSASTADEIAKLAELRASGVLSDSEFDALKAKALH
jgi:ABC-type multidrug transport system fused ATPase/permease subunit